MDEGAGRRSGLDAAWVASVAGFSCFGELKPAAAAGAAAGAAAAEETAGGEAAEAAEREPLVTELAVGGGVTLRGRPGLLEVSLAASFSPSSDGAVTTLRRSWAGGSRYAEVE